MKTELRYVILVLVVTTFLGAFSKTLFRTTEDVEYSKLSGSVNTFQTYSNGQKIAFISDRTGTRQIHIMNPDGSKQTHLPTHGPAEYPKWSPDGTKILFLNGSSEEEYSISVMYRDGSNIVTLLKSYHNGGPFVLYPSASPNWSSDGLKIVFRGVECCDTSGEVIRGGIYTMELDTLKISQLTDSLVDYLPDWSPDGTKIAFMRQPAQGENFEIYTIDTDGSNLSRLTYSQADDHQPDWSPDGTKIVFSYYPNILMMNADGSNRTIVYDGNVDGIQGGRPGFYPTWSPDGAAIAFQLFCRGCDGTFSSGQSIWVVDSNGSNPTINISNNPADNFAPDWSPSTLSPIPSAARFSAENYIVNEGGSDAEIAVVLHAPPSLTTTINYATNDGSAVAGDDYIATSGTLTFTPGVTKAIFAIPILDDDTPLESSETLTITLSNPINAELWPPKVTTLKITENDLTAPPVTTTVDKPHGPPQSVNASVDTLLGPVKLILRNVTNGGSLTVTASITTPSYSPQSFTLFNQTFDIAHSGIRFDEVTVNFLYNENQLLSANIPEDSLRLLHYEFEKWADITSDLDTNVNSITGTAKSLSPFVIGTLNLPECSFSINGGDTHTGQLEVQIFSNMPDAEEVLISNDAGFAGAQWQPYRTAIDWTLNDPGDQIVTLLAYIRLRDSAGNVLCGGLSLNDDIIYDPLSPIVEIKTVSKSGLHVTAEDQRNGSGVNIMQITTDSSFAGVQWELFSAFPQINLYPGEIIQIRVQDGAGNISAPVSAITPNGEVFLPVVIRRNVPMD